MSWSLDEREGVGLLTFTRPPANWMDLASMTELAVHLEALAERASEALRIGLLNAVLPAEGFVDHALTWCAKITRHPASSIVAAKRAVVEGMALPLDEGLALESRMFRQINAGDEARARNAAVSRPT